MFFSDCRVTVLAAPPVSESLMLSQAVAICICEEATIREVSDPGWAAAALGVMFNSAQTIQIKDDEKHKLIKLTNQIKNYTHQQVSPWGDQKRKHAVLFNIHSGGYMAVETRFGKRETKNGKDETTVILSQLIPIDDTRARFSLFRETLFYVEIDDKDLFHFFEGLIERSSKQPKKQVNDNQKPGQCNRIRIHPVRQNLKNLAESHPKSDTWSDCGNRLADQNRQNGLGSKMQKTGDNL